MYKCIECGLIGDDVCEVCPEYNKPEYMATLKAKGRLQGTIPGKSEVEGTLHGIPSEEPKKIIGKLKGSAYHTDTYLKMKRNPLFNLKMKTKTKYRYLKRKIRAWLGLD